MIMYFSATGNSRHCAEYIAAGTGDSLFSIKDAMKKGINEVDCNNNSLLGIVVPTYGWGIPWAVSDYLKSINFTNLPKDAYIFSIHTCGNMSGAGTVRMREIIEGKGYKLSAAFSVVTTSSEYLFGKKTTEEEKKKIMDDADKRLDTIIEIISNKQSGDNMRKTVPAFAEKLINKLYISSQRKVKDFRVSDNCIGCGKCAKGCPQNIIEIREGYPVWTADKCMSCFACVTYCPKHAISREK